MGIKLIYDLINEESPKPIHFSRSIDGIFKNFALSLIIWNVFQFIRLTMIQFNLFSLDKFIKSLEVQHQLNFSSLWYSKYI